MFVPFHVHGGHLKIQRRSYLLLLGTTYISGIHMYDMYVFIGYVVPGRVG